MDEKGEIVWQGFLKKKSPSGFGLRLWQTRYFRLQADVMLYYKSEDDVRPQGIIPLFFVKQIVHHTDKKNGVRCILFATSLTLALECKVSLRCHRASSIW